MKLKKYFSFALAALLSVGFFASCSDDDNNDHKDTNPLPNNFYVLNRGNFNANNASVAFFDAATQDMEGKWYQDANAGSGLGDSAEDMIIFNNHVYVTVYGSNRLAMMDMNGKLVNSLEPVVNESPASPRSLVAYNNKLYVSYYSAHAVAVINPTNLSVEKMIPVGRYPEQLTVAGGKLYVANSGGMDYPVYGNTISVVDLSSETVVSEIEVALNPCRLASSTSGDVWVVSMGNYGDVPNTLQWIKAGTSTVETLGEGSRLTIVNDKVYVLYAPYGMADAVFVKKYDAKTAAVESSDLIPALKGVDNLSGINIDPKTENIFVLVAPYGETGSYKVYKSNGESLDIEDDTEGYDPQKICFIAK